MAFETLAQFGSAFISKVNTTSGITENSPTGLDSASPLNPDQNQPYGSLGDFAKRIDQSAQRVYLGSGTVRNVRPRSLEVLMQQPDLVICIKKRMFSSLIENYRFDLMDSAEKIYIRAAKHLFQNICQRVSVYEKLSKIEQIAVKQGFLDDSLLPLVLDGVDSLEALGTNLFDAKTKGIFETLRKLKFLSEPHSTTTWVTDQTSAFISQLGDGTGVFELTLVENFSSTISTQFGGGSCSFSIQDPYDLMRITEQDIEHALSQAVGRFDNSSFYQNTQQDLEQGISDLKDQLNQLRAGRNVSLLTIMINESAYLFKKVRVIIDEEAKELQFTFNPGIVGIGSAVTFDPNALEGRNGLNTSEIKILQTLIRDIFTLLGLHQTIQTQIKQYNQDTSYIRSKLRLHYLNRYLIQQMDVIHAFISSQTTRDARISFGGGNSFNPSFQTTLDQNIAGINEQLSAIGSFFSNNDSSFLEIEKNTIVGEDFPMWLWMLLRNQYTRQAGGQHVFAGVVTGVDPSWDGGRHTISVSAKDNTYYFDQSPININPSLDVFNGALYDRLTPFQDKFDISSGFPSEELPVLLEENIKLLQSGLLRFPDGRFRGSSATALSYLNQNGQRADQQFQKVFYDPPGFVYRGKQGIASRVLFQQPFPSDLIVKDTSPNINQNPFAGQDVMNVLSLLITGQPYNFNNFVKSALYSSNLSRDDLTNQSGTVSYYRGLIQDLVRQNATWGNFLPFKKMVVNESAYRFLLSGEVDLVTKNNQISDLLRQRAIKFDQLTVLVPQFARNPQFYQTATPLTTEQSNRIDVASVAKLGEEIIKLDLQISQLQNDFKSIVNSPGLSQQDGVLKIFGNDISFDTSQTGIDTSLSESDRVRNRSQFRKKINYLTQRLLFKVKANEDHNYFIVSDDYDKNYDIQAFEKTLSDRMELFQSTYTTVGKQIETVAKLLGLEIYADSQGHIQARPPQYNRMPSSVLEEMLQKKTNTGIQIFPRYLESLLSHQFQGILDQLEIIEDEIRLKAAALGYITDSDIANFLKGSVTGGIVSTDNSFTFLSDETTGKIGSNDIRLMVDQASSDQNQHFQTQSLSDLQALGNQANRSISGVNFDIVTQTQIVNQQAFKNLVAVPGISTRYELIANRLFQKKGEKSPTLTETLSGASAEVGLTQTVVLQITNSIAPLIADRSVQLKLLVSNIKNLSDGLELNNNPDEIKGALYPNLYQSKPFPEILEHLIEDESYDDLGPNSGKRYVIDGSQVLSMRLHEEPPPYTMVEVNGLFAEGLAEPGGDFSVNGGNALSSAAAVDYDMWEMYGFRGSNPVAAPFFSDPEGQCAPYAVFLLNLARSNIQQGSVTVVGNEFYQAGEVVYLEDVDMLYYIESVSHSFSYNSNFTTTLQLKYGHSPGEYFPTMLDLIGKTLYTQKHQASMIKHFRQTYPDGSVPVNVLIADNTNSDTTIANLLTGPQGDRNKKALANMSILLAGLLNLKTGLVPEVQLRIYSNSDQSISISSSLSSIANSVKTWFTNPTQLYSDNQNLLPDANFKLGTGVDPALIKIIEVDLAKTDTSPSTGAWHASEIATQNSQIDVDAKVSSLYANIIDFWVIYKENTANTSSISNSPAGNQFDQTQLNNALQAFQAKLGL